ncbi:MAG: hypothetical protein WC666_04830 [Candidatus Paceibacterota bacterium]|jgi:hypothetical protein
MADQNELLENIEGLGDLGVFNAKRKKNKATKNVINKLSSLLEKLFEIKEKDLEKFERLSYSKELLDLYKANPDEASERLFFYGASEAPLYSSLINQIKRIYDVAINAENTDITKQCAYSLIKLLRTLSIHKNNHLFIDRILHELAYISEKALKLNDPSVYASTTDWYKSVVLNDFLVDLQFEIEYLEKFNEAFASSIRRIITNDNAGVFEAMLSSVIDTILPTDGKHDLWNLDDSIMSEDFDLYRKLDENHQVQAKITKLISDIEKIRTAEQFSHWMSEYKKLIEVLEPHIKETSLDQFKANNKNILESAVTYLKFNQLIDLFFDIGSWCIFKSNLEFVKKIWEYKQPPDTNTTYIGHNIFPDEPQSLINYFFAHQVNRDRFMHWEGHHGAEIYFKQYFILLLARNIQRVKIDTESVKLPALKPYEYNEIINNMDAFKAIANDLATKTELLGTLNISESTLKNDVVAVLERLNQFASNALEYSKNSDPLSKDLIDKFESNFLEGYKSHENLPALFRHFGLNKNIEPEVESMGATFLVDREAFLEDWSVDFSFYAKQLGENLARNKDLFLFSKLDITLEPKSLSELLNQETISYDQPVLIVSLNRAARQFLSETGKFTPHWELENKPKISRYYGTVKIGDKEALIISGNKKDEDALLIDASAEGFGAYLEAYPFKLEVIDLATNDEEFNKLVEANETADEVKLKKWKSNTLVRVYYKAEFELVDNPNIMKLRIDI